jgi:tetratricopeptide (TPR) repeat protein
MSLRAIGVVAHAALLLAALAAPAAGQEPALTAARRQAAAGRYLEAATTYRLWLEGEPRDTAALGELAGVLEAAGEWRQAVPILERYLAIAEDPLRLRQLGLYQSWGGHRDTALALLGRARELRPNSPAFDLPYADVLAWEPEGREQAVALLRSLHASLPGDLRVLERLATILSWTPRTRAEAAEWFERGLAADSNAVGLLIGYANLLSWDPGTRARARGLYDRVLSRDPTNVHARTGMANLLAWGGSLRAALAMYDEVLAREPGNAAALRGRGFTLNRLRRFEEARGPLRTAVEAEPGNPWTMLELAYTAVNQQRFTEAHQWLSQSEGADITERLVLEDSVRRALGSYVEVTGGMRDRQDQLDGRWLGARLSVALDPDWRGEGGAQSTRYEDAAGRFDAVRVALRLRYALEERFGADAGVAVWRIDDVDESEWDGWLRGQARLSRYARLRVGVERRLVEETRRTVQGIVEAGELRGVVHANLGQVGLELRDLPGRFDASLGGVIGPYTGRGLASNWRYGADAELGLVVRTSQPYARLGYRVQYASFDYDASLAGASAPDQRGDYFSPAEYALNVGVLQISHRFGRRVAWEFDGRLGAEWVRPQEGALSDTRPAGAVNTHLVFRIGAGTDLDLRYLYVDAFNAFQLHEGRVAIRQHF